MERWAYDFDQAMVPNVYRVQDGPFGYSPVFHNSPEAALKAAIRELTSKARQIGRAIEAAKIDLDELKAASLSPKDTGGEDAGG